MRGSESVVRRDERAADAVAESGDDATKKKELKPVEHGAGGGLCTTCSAGKESARKSQVVGWGCGVGAISGWPLMCGMTPPSRLLLHTLGFY